ncbi:NAD(P)H-dependent oxidoreductase [Candidatus Kaiserbacteria bacterium]|nr:NAD(P)H-dependent oxidoreductase [Candidatus Kaiserbacteria bacterium]
MTNTAKKIVILLGHSAKDSHCRRLADAYEGGARGAGHTVERFDIGDLYFDPVLHDGYRTIQDLEPDLIRFQEALKGADHFVILYPNWWSGPPAILKGFFDRVWLPGFAYQYIKLRSGHNTPFWHRLLKGKTARLIVTTGMRPMFLRMLYGNFLQQVSVGILWFAGLRVEETVFGPTDGPHHAREDAWVAQARSLGARAK